MLGLGIAQIVLAVLSITPVGAIRIVAGIVGASSKLAGTFGLAFEAIAPAGAIRIVAGTAGASSENWLANSC